MKLSQLFPNCVIRKAQDINRYLYLVAFGFIAMELQQSAATWLQKFCLAQAEDSDSDTWEWPRGCLSQIMWFSPIALLQLVTRFLQDMTIWEIAASLWSSVSGALVSYYVTVLALVDQLVAVVFFLWENDGYLADDRQVFELSFLYARSLYDIRTRSTALMSSFQTFLTGDQKRIEWISSLERFRAAFDSCELETLSPTVA